MKEEKEGMFQYCLTALAVSIVFNKEKVGGEKTVWVDWF